MNEHKHRPYHRSPVLTVLAMVMLVATHMSLVRFCDAYAEVQRDRPTIESSHSLQRIPDPETAMARTSPAESLCFRAFDHAALGLAAAFLALLIALGLDLGRWSERHEWAETLATRLQFFGRFIALLGLGLALLVLQLTSELEFQMV